MNVTASGRKNGGSFASINDVFGLGIIIIIGGYRFYMIYTSMHISKV